MSGEIVVSETPNWLNDLEAKREQRLKARLGHEAGAGAPCLKCGDKCPGLDLHFWRKSCKVCRCPKEEHDVPDDDIYGWAQFQLLGSKPNKIKTKIVLPGKNDEVELEWAPKGQKDTIDKYLKTLPPEALPVKGSQAAQERKQLLQKQIPVHDIDPALCHELNEEEVTKMEEYIAHIKKSSVGVGQIVNLSSVIKANLHNISPQEAHIIASRYAKGIPFSEILKLQSGLAQNLERLTLNNSKNANNPLTLPSMQPNKLHGSIPEENMQNSLPGAKFKDISHPWYTQSSPGKGGLNPQYSENFIGRPLGKNSDFTINEKLLQGTNFDPSKTPSQFLGYHTPGYRPVQYGGQPPHGQYQDQSTQDNIGHISTCEDISDKNKHCQSGQLEGDVKFTPAAYGKASIEGGQGLIKPSFSHNLPGSRDNKMPKDQYGFENPYFSQNQDPKFKLKPSATQKSLPLSNYNPHSELQDPTAPRSVKDLIYSTYDPSKGPIPQHTISESENSDSKRGLRKFDPLSGKYVPEDHQYPYKSDENFSQPAGRHDLAKFDPITGKYILEEQVSPLVPGDNRYLYDPSNPGQYLDPKIGQYIDPKTGQHIDPETGRYIIDPKAGQYVIDPKTGQYIDPKTGQYIDPKTGQYVIDPKTGQYIYPKTGQCIDPMTGHFVDPKTGQYVIDPKTGQYIDPKTGQYIDPKTGQCIDHMADHFADPKTGQYIIDPKTGQYIDPKTGQYIDPKTGQYIDHMTGHFVDPKTGQYIIDPKTGEYIDPKTGQYVDPKTGQDIDPKTGQYIDPKTIHYVVDPKTGQYIDPRAGYYIDCKTGQYVDPKTGQFVEPKTGQHIDPKTGQYIIGPKTGHYIDSKTGQYVDPKTGQYVDPKTGRYVDPKTGQCIYPKTGQYIIDPKTGQYFDPKTGQYIDPKTGQYVDPKTSQYIDPKTGQYISDDGRSGNASAPYARSELETLMEGEETGQPHLSPSKTRKPLSALQPGNISVPEDYLEPHMVNVGAIQDINPEIRAATTELNPGFDKESVYGDGGAEYSPESIREILNNIKLPDCHYCKKPFEENEFAVTIDRANVLFHAQCFRCAGCNQSLADNIYFYNKDDNNVYCGRDYAKIKGYPRCSACDELIFTKEYCLAENATFHLKHFCCFQCDSPLAGQDYTLEDEKPYCLPCYESSKAAKCSTCEKVIKPDEVGCQLNGVHFHAENRCFRCIVCSVPLMGKKLLLRNEKLYCSHDCFNTGKK